MIRCILVFHHRYRDQNLVMTGNDAKQSSDETLESAVPVVGRGGSREGAAP